MSLKRRAFVCVGSLLLADLCACPGPIHSSGDAEPPTYRADAGARDSAAHDAAAADLQGRDLEGVDRLSADAAAEERDSFDATGRDVTASDRADFDASGADTPGTDGRRDDAGGRDSSRADVTGSDLAATDLATIDSAPADLIGTDATQQTDDHGGMDNPTAFSVPGQIDFDIDPIGDIDCFRLAVPTDQVVTLEATGRGVPCVVDQHDTVFSLYQDGETDAEALLDVDDLDGVGWCSRMQIAPVEDHYLLCIQGYQHAATHLGLRLVATTSPIGPDEAGGLDAPELVSLPMATTTVDLIGSDDLDCFGFSLAEAQTVTISTAMEDGVDCPETSALLVYDQAVDAWRDYLSGWYLSASCPPRQIYAEPGDYVICAKAHGGLVDATTGLQLSISASASPIAFDLDGIPVGYGSGSCFDLRFDGDEVLSLTLTEADGVCDAANVVTWLQVFDAEGAAEDPPLAEVQGEPCTSLQFLPEAGRYMVCYTAAAQQDGAGGAFELGVAIGERPTDAVGGLGDATPISTPSGVIDLDLEDASDVDCWELTLNDFGAMQVDVQGPGGICNADLSLAMYAGTATTGRPFIDQRSLDADCRTQVFFAQAGTYQICVELDGQSGTAMGHGIAFTRPDQPLSVSFDSDHTNACYRMPLDHLGDQLVGFSISLERTPDSYDETFEMMVGGANLGPNDYGDVSRVGGPELDLAFAPMEAVHTLCLVWSTWLGGSITGQLDATTAPLPPDEAGGLDAPEVITVPAGDLGIGFSRADDLDCFAFNVASYAALEVEVQGDSADYTKDIHVALFDAGATRPDQAIEGVDLGRGEASIFYTEAGDYVVCAWRSQDGLDVLDNLRMYIDARSAVAGDRCEWAVDMPQLGVDGTVQITGNTDQASMDNKLFYRVHAAAGLRGYLMASATADHYGPNICVLENCEDVTATCDYLGLDARVPVVADRDYIISVEDAGAFTLFARHIPPQSNETCQAARTIDLATDGSATSIEGFTVGALDSQDVDDSSSACQAVGSRQAPDVYYVFTTPGDGAGTVRAALAADGYAPAMFVFTGSCQAPSTDLFCRGDTSTYASNLWARFSVTANQSYYVVVDGYGDALDQGEFTLDLNYYVPQPAPPGPETGDTCADAIPLLGTSGSYHGSTVTGTDSLARPGNHGCSNVDWALGKEKFYTVTVQPSRTLDVRVEHGDPTKEVALYLLEGACGSFAGDACSSSASFSSAESETRSIYVYSYQAATTYFIVVDARHVEDGEDYDLFWTID